MELEPKEKAKKIYYECETIALDVIGGMNLSEKDVKESSLLWVSDKLIELGNLKDTKQNTELYDYFLEVETELQDL